MISKNEFIMIYTFHKQGHSIRSISRITGIDRRTVSKRLKLGEYVRYKHRDYSSKLDPYKEYVKKRFLRHFHILFQLVLYLKRLKNKVIMARLE